MERKVMVVAGANHQLITHMFRRHDWSITFDITDADLVCFTGGEDVSPEMYGTHSHPTTHSNPSRDSVESDIFSQAIELGVPVVGICRGAQFLHVKNGGKLWQHVDGHTKPHMAFLPGTGINNVWVSSTHHQMIKPDFVDFDAQVLLVAEKATTKETMSDAETSLYKVSRMTSKSYPDDDIEAMFYEGTKSLAFQPHPEFYDGGKDTEFKECQDLFFGFIENYLMSDEIPEEKQEVLKFVG